jgi:C-terminal domain 7 of the ABC-three component (ABC-3C) systems
MKLRSVAGISHTAAPAALGYIYQCRWPLLALLRDSADRPDCLITLELHDDVAWDHDGTPTELLQVKHHINSVRGLGDKDVDWWRTIQAWMDVHDAADATGPRLAIVTTQLAPEGSAAAVLRPSARDVVLALQRLETAARDSQAEVTRAARERFLALTTAARAVFVARMHVLDTAPGFDDLDAEVRRELRHALPHAGHQDTFMDLLWSWWNAKVIDMLRGKRRGVSYLEVSAYLDDLKGQFSSPDMLPTTVFEGEFDQATVGDYLDRPFVHQLRWVGTVNRTIQSAIIDYYRAYAQSARWVEDDLIGSDELDSFECRLKDEWEREFDFMVAGLPADADDRTKREAGLRLLRERMNQAQVRLRARYDEPFFSRGIHHGLADDGRAGWHPEFEKRLEGILLGAGS